MDIASNCLPLHTHSLAHMIGLFICIFVAGESIHVTSHMASALAALASLGWALLFCCPSRPVPTNTSCFFSYSYGLNCCFTMFIMVMVACDNCASGLCSGNCTQQHIAGMVPPGGTIGSCTHSVWL